LTHFQWAKRPGCRSSSPVHHRRNLRARSRRRSPHFGHLEPMVTGAQDELEAAGVTDPSGDFAAPLNPSGWGTGRDPTAGQPLLPQPRREAALQVISRRYEHGSIILPTNRGIAELGAIFDDT